MFAFQKAYDFSKYAYADDLTSSQEEEMLAAIQGTRSAEFEPENRMSPRAEMPPSGQKPFLADLDSSETIAEKKDTVAPLLASHKMDGHVHSGLQTVGASRDSPTLNSDDDTSYSTWKPVSNRV